jgi:hypothetical protein
MESNRQRTSLAVVSPGAARQKYVYLNHEKNGPDLYQWVD